MCLCISIFSGQVRICYDDSLRISDGCPSSVPTIQWITKAKSDASGRPLTWRTEPFFLALIGSNAFEDISRNCRRPEDLLKGVFRLAGASPDDLSFLRERQARQAPFFVRFAENFKLWC